MKKHSSHNNILHVLATSIGAGLISGLAGTVAITISQMIELKITGRKPSTVPADAVEKTLDLKATDETEKTELSQKIHWAYGMAWGLPRGLLGLAGLKGFPAAISHFTMVWGTSLVMLPNLDLAPPVNQEKPKTMLVDIIHHAVYALAAGLVYDAIAEE